jgi:hypothetical protein
MKMNIIRRLLARHRFPQIMLLGLLAFGILIKPVLFSMGEMHELQHDPNAAISHVDFAVFHEESTQNTDQGGQTNAHTLHALTNFAHNCDQPTCTEAGCFASLGAGLCRAHIATPADAPRKSAIPTTLFRPPISI